MRATRTSLLVVLALTGLALGAAPASAASTTTPTRAGNDGVKTFSVSADSFVEPGDEKVVLHASPANGQADIPGTVTGTGSCTGFTLPGLSQAECGGPLTFTADLTNVATGTYQVVETRTDQATFPPGDEAPVVDGTVVVFAQPAFAAGSAITPATRGQNSVSVITVKGSGFKAGMTADFGAGTTTTGLSVASPSQLTATVTVSADAVPGPRDVVLISPDDGATVGAKARATKAAGFTITAAPTVTSLSPAQGTVGTKASVTFTGTGFVPGDVSITVPQVLVSNVVVTSTTTATADLTPGTGAQAGPHSVFFTNPDGGRGSLTGGFTVIAPPDKPVGVLAQPGDTAVSLAWTAPTSAGTSAVTGYRVTPSGGVAPVEVTGTSATVNGLTNGTSYTFTVAAKNAAAGYGVESAQVAATPKYAVTLVARSSTAQLTSGGTARVSGSLVRTTGALPIPGATITLKYQPAVGSPVFRSVVTDAQGVWADAVRSFTYSTRVTATYGGNPTIQAKAVTLPAINVSTKVTRTAPVAGASSKVGTLLTVTGTTSPNKAGRPVYLYRVLAGGHLQALTKGIVSPNGTFALKIKLAKGAYALRVGVPAAAGNTTGYTTAFTHRRV